MSLFKHRKLTSKEHLKTGFSEEQEKKILNIPLELIEPNPLQPRIQFDENYIRELAYSIEKYELIHPITIMQHYTDHYLLIAGENRYRAFKALGRLTIPSIVVKKRSDNTLAIEALIENIHRKNLHPIEIGLAFENLLTLSPELNTQSELGELLGLGKATISKYINSIKLSSKTCKLALEEEYRDINILSQLRTLNPETQYTLLKKIIKEQCDRKTASGHIKSVKNENYQKPAFEITEKRNHVEIRIEKSILNYQSVTNQIIKLLEEAKQ